MIDYRLPDAGAGLIPPEADAVRIRAFALAAELEPLAEWTDQSNEFAWAAYRALGQSGFLAMLPGDGHPAPCVSYALAAETFGRTSGAFANMVQLSTVAGCFLDRYGDTPAGRKLVAQMQRGEALCAVAMSEPNAGSDVAGISTMAHREAAEYIISGEKCLVTGARVASHAIVTAKLSQGDSAGRIGTFLVDLALPGVEIGASDDLLGARGMGTASIAFRTVKVPREACLGEEGKGIRQILSVIDIGRIGIAALAVGLAAASVEHALTRASRRQQFDKPILENQGLQFRLAELYAELSAAQTLLYSAACLHDLGRPFSLQAAAAKFLATEVALRCATAAVQLYGGDGFRRGSTVERFFRDAKGAQIYEGTNEIQRLVIARHLMASLDGDVNP